MAINVDTVYKTVLLILNQQQRGYMTPDEFNRVGTQVQLGIFENYANDLNQQMRVPQNDTEYGNRFKNTATKIDIFKKIRTATYNNVGGYYELPTAVDTPLITPQAFTGNGVLTAFTLVAPWTTLLGSIDSQVKITVAGVEVFNWTYDNQSLTVTFTTPPANAAAISISLYAMDFYRLGTVIYNDVTEIQLMDRNEWYLIKKAPLVAPTPCKVTALVTSPEQNTLARRILLLINPAFRSASISITTPSTKSSSDNLISAVTAANLEVKPYLGRRFWRGI